MAELRVDLQSKSGKQDDSLSNVIECSICKGTFREPIVLSCLHTFCLNCLKELSTKQNKSAGDDMICPLCRKKFCIPEQGFEKLTRNCFVENLIENKNALKSITVTDLCEACEEETSGIGKPDRFPSVAEFYCTDCQLALCTDCHQHHLKSKLFKHHKVLNKDENFQKSYDHRIMPVYCIKHCLKPLDIYCSKCKDAVCSICFVEDHKSHDGERVESVAGDFQEKITSNIDNLMKFVPRLQQKKQHLEVDKDDFVAKLKNLELEIDKTREDLKAIVDAQSNSLLEQLKCRGEESLKKMESCADDIDTLTIGVQNFRSYCSNLMSLGSDSSICKSIESLDKRASELQELCVNETEAAFEFSRFCLRKAFKYEIPETFEESLVGELEGSIDYRLGPKLPFVFDSNVSNTGTIKHNSNQSSGLFGQPVSGFSLSVFGTSTQLTINPSCRIVMGIAVLGNEFFAVVKTQLSIIVQVHDIKTTKQKRRWISERLVDINDIKGSEQNKCLFIMNKTSDENEILIFDPNGTLLAFWLVKDATGQMTITPESNVLFTAWNKDQLLEYTFDGKLVRVIPLTWNYEISHPWHAIKLDPENYLLSHGNSQDRQRRICIIDADGKILRSIATAGDNDQFQCPVYMEKDRDGNIVVVDSGLRRLMIFTPNLKQINTTFYTSSDTDLAPQKVLIDDYHKRVFIVERHLSSRIDDLSIFSIETIP